MAWNSDPVKERATSASTFEISVVVIVRVGLLTDHHDEEEQQEEEGQNRTEGKCLFVCVCVRERERCHPYREGLGHRNEGEGSGCRHRSHAQRRRNKKKRIMYVCMFFSAQRLCSAFLRNVFVFVFVHSVVHILYTYMIHTYILGSYSMLPVI